MALSVCYHRRAVPRVMKTLTIESAVSDFGAKAKQKLANPAVTGRPEDVGLDYAVRRANSRLRMLAPAVGENLVVLPAGA